MAGWGKQTRSKVRFPLGLGRTRDPAGAGRIAEIDQKRA